MGNQLARICAWFCRCLRSNDSESISDNISELRIHLKYMIEINYGLLPTLRCMKVLSLDEIEQVECQQTKCAKIDLLLDMISTSSSRRQKQFLEALRKTQQTHVTNYIHHKGSRTTATDSWPLYDTDAYDMVEKHWIKLVEVIDAQNGLLDELLSIKCISLQQKQDIESGKTDSAVNETLLRILQRGSVDDYNGFMHSLSETKQYQVVFLLAPDLAEKVQLLTEQQSNALLTKHSLLVATMDTRHGLLAELFATGCLTRRQKDFVEAAATQAESNGRLLNIVRRGRAPDFYRFVECLAETGQHHLRSAVLDGGVEAVLVAKISAAEGDVAEMHNTQIENHIVEQFMSLLNSCNDESRLRLRFRVNQIVDQLQRRDVGLAALDTGGSVRLFFICRSVNGVHHLREMYASSELSRILEDLFAVLLDNVLPVAVLRLTWNSSDYWKCMENVCTSANLSLISNMFRNVQETQDCSDHPTVFDMHQLPFELIEMLLLKTAEMLHVALMKHLDNPDMYTFVTLSTVSRLWWVTLTYRKYTKRMLKRNFKRACHPYKSKPTVRGNMQVECGRDIWGVAEWKNKLYVACDRSKIIEVFRNEPPFDRLEKIEVGGLQSPSDIVICQTTERLYIADLKQCTVWRVNLMTSDKEAATIGVLLSAPRSLSSCSARLLITPWDGAVIYVYSDDGVLAKAIPLPDYLTALHGVQSRRSTYLVSYYGRFIDDSQAEHRDGVIEIDDNGNVVNRYRCPLDVRYQLMLKPHHLIVGEDGCVLIADRQNERIVQLTTDLKFRRVAVSSLQGQPFRMCYCHGSGLLFLACYYSSTVQVISMSGK